MLAQIKKWLHFTVFWHTTQLLVWVLWHTTHRIWIEVLCLVKELHEQGSESNNVISKDCWNKELFRQLLPLDK